MSHTVKILEKTPVTHNVNRYVVEKPEGYTFTPGQATEVAIDKDNWRDETRPFTFTSLNEDEHLEFTIKSYRDHDGVTANLEKLRPGDALIINDPWGTIHYDGPGYFIAAGAGITPFLSIFRQLAKKGGISDCSLIFSNQTLEDIILKDELEATLGVNCHFTVTQQDTVQASMGRIDKNFLKEKVIDPEKKFYICGPEQFVDDMQKLVPEVGGNSDSLIFEE